MMGSLKRITQRLLIGALGFENYLFFVAQMRIATIKAFRYEADFLYFLSMVPDDGVILDIGANIGVTAYFLAAAKPGSRVHAFEPGPENFKSLTRVVARHTLANVTVHECGLGRQAAELPMIMPVIGGIKRHALCQVDDGHSEYKDGIRFRIKIEALDGVPDLKTLTDVHAIKIDVEEFEAEVLKGGMELIRRCRPLIFCEIWKPKNRDEIRTLFEGERYRMYGYEHGVLKPAGSGIKNFTGNFFIIPDECPLPQ